MNYFTLPGQIIMSACLYTVGLKNELYFLVKPP